MLAGEASQAHSQDPHARLSRAALRHLALLLLLTPLLGGLRILIVHVDQRTVAEPIVVRELVEVPRTEYVQIEVPVSRVIVVEVPARAAQVPEQPSLPDTSTTTPPSASALAAPAASASVEPEGWAAGSVGDGEAAASQQPDPPTVVASVPARSYRPGPSQQAFELQPSENQLASEPLAEAPPGEPNVVAEAPAPAAPLSPAQRALSDFYAYTDQNWSVQGYSSAEEMRDVLGNSTTGWLNETKRASVTVIDSADAPVGREVPTRGESESRPEPIVLAQPTTTTAPSLDGFYAYIEQNWSALGYSSAEEMRRALTAD